MSNSRLIDAGKQTKPNDPALFVPLTISLKTAVIHLTRGLHSLIDAEDWEAVFSSGKWYAHRANPGRDYFYARRGWHTPEGNGRIFLHNQILPPEQDRRADHINLNRLDNRRGNLRLASRSQNMVNRISKGKSGYRGVTARPNGYLAQIGSRDAQRRLGVFPTALAAAKAYDVAAKDRYGEFARLNFDWQALLAEFTAAIFVPVRHPAYRSAQARADVILAMPDQPEWFETGTLAALREFAAAVAARGAAELAEIQGRTVQS